MRKLSRSGDTIIEVMIALAIIGLVIALTYATSSRALRTGRAAQERTEAQKIAEGQLESLKFLADSNVKGLTPLELTGDYRSVYANMYSRASFAGSSSFCITSSAGTVALARQSMIVPNQYVDPSDNYDLTFSTTGAPVSGQTYNLNCAVGINNRYKTSIERTDSIVGPETVSVFSVRVRWQRIGGGKDEVKIVYRLNRGQFRK